MVPPIHTRHLWRRVLDLLWGTRSRRLSAPGGDEPTDLKEFPNSPGYRLILNNILFPAAKKPPKKLN